MNEKLIQKPEENVPFLDMEQAERMMHAVRIMCEVSDMRERRDYNASRVRRREELKNLFDKYGLPFELHTSPSVNAATDAEKYTTFECTFSPQDSSPHTPHIVLSSHFDAVADSPGANDNASSVVASLEVAKSIKDAIQTGTYNGPKVTILIFDGEEKDCIGSQSFLAEKKHRERFNGAQCINLELVGMGCRPILWPIKDVKEEWISRIQESLGGTDVCLTVGSVVGHTADHRSFREIGAQSVTLTLLPEEDIAALSQIIASNGNSTVRRENLAECDVFKKYHTPYDTPGSLDKKSLVTVVAMLRKLIHDIGVEKVDSFRSE